jgi:glucose-1-phosphate thymidylyltransferase
MGLWDKITSQFIEIIARRQGFKVACLEEIAFRMGYIDAAALEALAAPLAKNGYGQYLIRLLQDVGERAETPS